MREIDMLKDLPQATDRPAIKRTIQNKIVASYRDERFFDGDRADGYGGLVDDGRWKPVAERMLVHYGIKEASRILQFDSEKGFLLQEFVQLGMRPYGIESSRYACDFWDYKFHGFDGNLAWMPQRAFDIVIAIGSVYMRTLADGISLLKSIQHLQKHGSFITLGSFDTPEDERIFREWSLLGCTILSKPDWLEVLKHCGYTGDYKFVTARTLGLV